MCVCVGGGATEEIRVPLHSSVHRPVSRDFGRRDVPLLVEDPLKQNKQHLVRKASLSKDKGVLSGAPTWPGRRTAWRLKGPSRGPPLINPRREFVLGPVFRLRYTIWEKRFVLRMTWHGFLIFSFFIRVSYSQTLNSTSLSGAGF